MTAALTDHHGAIDPTEFDADHPETRPFMSARQAAMLASDRLWGSSSSEQLDRDRPRRIAAVGYAGRQGIMLSQAPHHALPEVRGYDYFPNN